MILEPGTKVETNRIELYKVTEGIVIDHLYAHPFNTLYYKFQYVKNGELKQALLKDIYLRERKRS